LTATRQRLFEHARDERLEPTTGAEIVPLPRDACLRCGGEITTFGVGQPALFIHGGYGATERTTIRLCTTHDCSWSMVVHVQEVNPRKW
jgi:hypothetical protein